ncbi:unnamed protein product [Urochloa decumbens]|uniref:Knottins-like domain-containing protein n=1 Tax=Urochloa decumbens TaxID=240449 RepID=A0ABC8VPB8_9POAL
MATSRRASFASAAVLLIVVVMATEIMHVQADNYCYSLSKTYKGWCTDRMSCSRACGVEDFDNYGGKCRGFLPARCWCYFKCKVVAENGHATIMGPDMHE